MGRLAAISLAVSLAGVTLAAQQAAPPASITPDTAPGDVVTLSVVGTTDLHGFVFPRGGRGGLALLGGYLRNLRAARDADGGGVVLVDAGDTFQGGIESNLSEGALVIDAYNAMGYTAAAIGNHEFDFGPADRPGARQALDDDPRGAVKARAAQARFPYLAANLIDASTDRPVEWPNVRPSAMVVVAGVRVGLIGVMTVDALRATLPVNVRGLRMAPIAPTVTAEARRLREAGAEVVIVVSHAGGSCARFDEPDDLSSCDPTAEIFAAARDLPPGLVDVIAAGHTHAGLAHRVNGITIVQGYSLGRAFARADVLFDRRTRTVVRIDPFAPRFLCGVQDPETFDCESRPAGAEPLPVARYEGRPVTPDPAVDAAMAPALQRVRDLQAMPLGVYLDTGLPRVGDPESPLGNLFADALRGAVRGADVAVNNNSRGGLRTDLPDGPLTFGRLYDVFPFDNRLVTLSMTGADLSRVFADEIRRNRRGALGISGVRVDADCSAGDLHVALYRDSGEPIRPDERLTVATMDSLASGSIFAVFSTPADFRVPEHAPLVREAVEDWLRQRGGRLDADQFVDPDHRRWNLPATPPTGCAHQ
ncbi:MAG: bifunctional UDP-sugar hydrolase/5'-nucleotidase [Vicinamibacterales bacterium]